MNQPSLSGKTLNRELHTFGAVMLGLGAMTGTGVFVSIGVAAGVAGPYVIPAIALAAAVAVCNALSSAQLAAAHPVSGGAYEYGHRLLTPQLGFTAGWMFLFAKSASAATAVLGCAGYLLHAAGIDRPGWLSPAATLTALGVTIVVLAGIRRTQRVNTVIVSVTLSTLLLFVAVCYLRRPAPAEPFSAAAFTMTPFLRATALMFVAYTGYGRIATLGEEVQNPGKTIPRAIVITMAVSALLYILVGAAAIQAVGAEELGRMTGSRAAPLESVLAQLGAPTAARLVAAGAVTAMLGVFLNLLLGLSRVLLAMGRRREMPTIFGRVHEGSPRPAILGVATLILMLIWIGDIRITWSFSAFTVLIYYAITNLAALRLPAEQRLYPRFVSLGGLLACLFLAFQVDRFIWITGLGLILFGLFWQYLFGKTAVATR